MTPAAHSAAPEAGTRPRVEGDREQEILDATLHVLADVGYDRLTMDAVATAARASKATLYRRWETKPALVIDALKSQKATHEPVDTGNLRDDLLGDLLRHGRAGRPGPDRDPGQRHDRDGARRGVRRGVPSRLHRPQGATSAAIFARAQARGELRDDVDLDVITPALPGIALHRQFMFGEVPDVDFITRVIDQIILPAVVAGPPTTTAPSPDPTDTSDPTDSKDVS